MIAPPAASAPNLQNIRCCVRRGNEEESENQRCEGGFKAKMEINTADIFLMQIKKKKSLGSGEVTGQDTQKKRYTIGSDEEKQRWRGERGE